MNNFLNGLQQSINKIDEKNLSKLKELVLNSGGKIVILGNGGSNAIASHIAEDYTKALRKPAICFSDAARLTCYANDYGYEQAFKQFLIEFVEPASLVILISSSGNSKNIINCAEYCSTNNLDYVILTGFQEDNKLRQYKHKAKLDFWVDSTDYGIVECMHEIILHSII